jgi:hypothetical protein
MTTQLVGNITVEMLEGMRVDDIIPVEVGNGCYRRDLASSADVRVWVVDISPGCEWPRVDQHDAGGEYAYVVRGELIEGELRFEAGTYLYYKPKSNHRPRSEKGVRLFGFNVLGVPSPDNQEV